MNPPMPRHRFLFLSLAALAVLAPATARAHAVVYPKASAAGIYERYVLRVPNERDVPTVRIEITFPAELTVVSFAEVPGWTLTALTDEAGRVTGAVWTGELGVGRFVELPFVGVNPERPTTLTWPVSQTYAGGERVDWTGPEESDTPVSATEIGSGEGPGVALWIAIVALAVALVSLGLALRPRRS